MFRMCTWHRHKLGVMSKKDSLLDMSSGHVHAVALLRECQALVKTPAHRLAFLQLLDALNTSHKAKRNFIQLMNDTFG